MYAVPLDGSPAGPAGRVVLHSLKDNGIRPDVRQMVRGALCFDTRRRYTADMIAAGLHNSADIQRHTQTQLSTATEDATHAMEALHLIPPQETVRAPLAACKYMPHGQKGLFCIVRDSATGGFQADYSLLNGPAGGTELPSRELCEEYWR